LLAQRNRGGEWNDGGLDSCCADEGGDTSHDFLDCHYCSQMDILVTKQ
jgi:hypothetical protein